MKRVEIYKRINENWADCEIGDLFLRLEGNNKWFGLTGQSTGKKREGYTIDNMERIYPPEDKVTVTIGGKETKISRESAQALKDTLNEVL